MDNIISLWERFYFHWEPNANNLLSTFCIITLYLSLLMRYLLYLYFKKYTDFGFTSITSSRHWTFGSIVLYLITIACDYKYINLWLYETFRFFKYIYKYEKQLCIWIMSRCDKINNNSFFKNSLNIRSLDYELD